MKQRLMIAMLMMASVIMLLSCSSSSDADSQIEIAGNWYVMQYWGTSITKTTYEEHSNSGTVKVTEDVKKTKNESWDKTFDYGKNIWSFKEDNTISITNTNLPEYLYYNIGGYILDSSTKKLTMQTNKGEVSAIYDITNYDQDMITLCCKPKIPDGVSISTYYSSGIGTGDSGTLYTIVSTDETIYLKLKRMK